MAKLNEYVKVAEAARILGVAQNTLRSWAEAGKIPMHKNPANGYRLFPDRHAVTVAFTLNGDEFSLYKSVTAYINQYIPQQQGQRKTSAALARTVLQRRLASSACAIHESLKRRLQKQQNLLDELEGMSPAQRSRRLAVLQGRLADAERDEDDLDDADRDQLIDEFTAAQELDQLRAEIAALKDLVEEARRVREGGNDSKLRALKDCLERAQFAELKDGRDEWDGPQGLSGGKDALVEKKKAKYRTRDFTERGDNERLGQAGNDGQPAPLIDVLHRVLWLMDNSPRKLAEFLTEVQPDHERLRVLAQTLAGAALSGKGEEDAGKLVSTTAAEQAALGKLLANWRAVVENAVVSKAEREDRKRGQERLFD